MKQITYKGALICLATDFSMEKTIQARREWNNIFKVLKEKNSAIADCYIQQNYPLTIKE